jgi:hypothetical protein
LEIIIEELEKKSKPFSLVYACPHIVKTFKFFCRILFGKQYSAHPNKGLTQCTLLYYACDQTHFVRLTIAMQNVINYGILWFPKMQYGIKDVLQA